VCWLAAGAGPALAQGAPAPSPERLCAVGAAYAEAGRDDKALDSYEAALEANPRLRCARKGVEALGPSWLERTMGTITASLPQALLGAALIALLLFALLLLGYSQRVYRVLVQIPGVGRLISPRMSMDPPTDAGLDPDKGVGEALAARIKERLQRVRDQAVGGRAASYELDYATGTDALFNFVSADGALRSALDKAGDVSGQTKVVAAVLNLLYTALPVPRVRVSGVLEPVPAPVAPASTVSATLTLAVDKGSRLSAATTLRGSCVARRPNATDYLALAEAAAVWIQYEVARVLRGEGAPGEANAYAHVREGIVHHRAGDDQAARLAFEAALAESPANWVARVNLALTECRLADDYERGIYVLDEALHAMVEPDVALPAAGPVPDGAPPHLASADYYRLVHQLAAQLLNAAAGGARPQANGVPGQDYVTRALGCAGTLALGADRMLGWYDQRRAGRPRRSLRLAPEEERLRRFLSEAVRPSADLLAAVAHLREGQLELANTHAQAVYTRIGARDKEPVSYRVHYTLACYEAELAALEADKGRRRSVSRAYPLATDLAAWRAEDPVERAFTALARSLTDVWGPRRDELVSWARKDPSLELLRRPGDLGERFDQIVNSHSAATPDEAPRAGALA
jgi:tetratricopeptide (TPR) repeat protein